MTKGNLDESQTRVRKEDWTRDWHLSQKPTLRTETTNSSPPCADLSPTPWDDGPESQGNPLPCLGTRNITTYICGS